MDYHKSISKIYDYLYNKTYRSNFKLDLSINNQKKQVENFLRLLANHYQLPSVGINYLIDYFCYSFAIRAEQNTKRKISLNWIIGKKMFDRWLKKPDEYQWQYKKYIKEFDINIDRIKDELHEEELISAKLDPAEEREKGRLVGEAQLYNCMLHTTMYNHKSVICLTCDNKKLCKKMLREKYPRIYKNRGYEK